MKIGNCEISNRLVVPAMVTNYNNADGTLTERFIAYHERKAQGGWGLIITENYSVSRHAMGYKFIGGLWDDAQIESNMRLTDRVHRYDSKIFCQLYHAGRQSKSLVNGGVPTVAPSATPCPWMRDLARPITREEIHQLVIDFGEAAFRAKKAGFDGIEIHSAHGYLLHEFLSPNTNKRTDEYGGNFQNRVRIVGEVIESIRGKVGADFPVTIRVSAIEFVPGGRSAFESRTLYKQFAEWGVDAIHVSSGMYGNGGIISPMFMNHGWIVEHAREAKSVVDIPIITVNRINDPLQAEDIVASEMADFVSMGRGSLADPALPNKAKNGKFEDIRYCIACMQGCVEQLSLSENHSVRCLVNPELGFEFETDLSPTKTKRRVYVAGGGPGGLQAALTAALKGHAVTLFEKSDELGGQFISASFPPYKGEFISLIAWLICQLHKSGVTIALNTELTAERVRADKPDVVIVATGAVPDIPPIEGIDDPKVKLAEDVMTGRVPTGDRIAVIGGGMVGTEAAAQLSLQLKMVTVVEMLPSLATDMFINNRDDLLKLLEEQHVGVITNAKVTAVCEQGVLYEKNGEIKLLPCETVVLATGTRSLNNLAQELEDYPGTVQVVGDAVAPRKALEAIREGFVAGLSI